MGQMKPLKNESWRGVRLTIEERLSNYVGPKAIALIMRLGYSLKMTFFWTITIITTSLVAKYILGI